MRLSVSLCLLLSGAALLVNGCGGGHGSGASYGTSRIVILWPDRSDSRLVPAAANSVKLTLSGPASITRVVARPPAGQNSTTITLADLATGNYTINATAYPNTDGTGTAQASGDTIATIQPDQVTDTALTMASTIATVSLGPANPTVFAGSTIALTATAKDASGAVVLTAGTWTWASSNTGNATVTGTTATVNITGVAKGSPTITATETESGKAGSIALTVRRNTGDLNMVVQ